MRWYCLFVFLLPFGLQAQDTLNYNELTTRSEGKNSKVKYLSGVTGGKQIVLLRTGKWLFLDEFDNVVKEVNYMAIKADRNFVKHGYEIYFDPENGDTLLMRQYDKGVIVNQTANRAAIIIDGSKILHIHASWGSLSIEETTTYPKDPDKALITHWSSTITAPDAIRNIPEYKLFEDSIGDPSILEPPLFTPLTEYNYIQNPQFEWHPEISMSVMSFSNQLPYWQVASQSPDLYVFPDASRSGSSFVGFRVFSMEKHIEYVQNELKEPLQKDSFYCFTMFVKLSPGSKYASNAIGVKFSDIPLSIGASKLAQLDADLVLEDQVLIFKTRWMKIQCTYKAKGGEKYVVIGSFQDHKKLKLFPVPGNQYESYYYLDDVTLNPISKPEYCPCNLADSRQDTANTGMSVIEDSPFEELEEGDTFILENINFLNDEDVLLSESYASLHELLEVMSVYPALRIELSGHTSIQGSYEHNLDLSLRRAEAVKQFLVLNGISEERIEVVGYGPDFPIADNSTEEGQHKNRRVEFRVLSL